MSKRKPKTKWAGPPPSFADIASMVNESFLYSGTEAEEAWAVIEDWMQEHPEATARQLWLATSPTLAQQGPTALVVGRSTTWETLGEEVSAAAEAARKMRETSRWPVHREMAFAFSVQERKLMRALFLEAKRQLQIHPHARWVRCLGSTQNQSLPLTVLHEILVDESTGGRDTHPRIQRTKQQEEDEAMLENPLELFQLRTRCLGAGCMNITLSSIYVPKEAENIGL